ncbi:MAG: hypothetical protein JXA18_04270 [Chitinispirillaceae bacterium]|nr:hypothetical protein [Chitinispirillaceae bacterium]
MNAEEKRRVVRGEVFVDGRWVPIDKKYEIERQRWKKIEAGYVFYQGEWMTIDEKLRRVVPPEPPEEKRAATVVINQYDNRTVYNVDNRTIHRHEHRHVHIDKEGIEEYMCNRLPGELSADTPSIDADTKKRGALAGKKENEAITDKRKVKGLLKPPAV